MSTTAAGTTDKSGRAADVQHYSMVIVWSDEDQAFLVHLPEWERGEHVFGPVTHAETYAEAAKNGQEALASLIASWQDLGWELPAPRHSDTFVLVDPTRVQGPFTMMQADETTETTETSETDRPIPADEEKHSPG